MAFSADVTRLLNNARVHLPGAIDSNMQLELFNVLNDFYQGSNIWQADIPVTVIAGTSTYTLTPVASASINRLMKLVNSVPLPVPAAMAVPGTLILNTQPSNDDTYTATVSLTVDDPLDADSNPIFPAWTLTKYGTGLLDGLVGRMMAQPAKPYSSPQMSTLRLKKFNAVIAQAKTETLHANLNNGQTWRFPQSFATRRH